MKESRVPEWDPKGSSVLRDPIVAYDAMRRSCPVAFSESLGWSLFRHADLVRVLADHEAFSNVVSKHRSVPNGMDPPEHTAYRRVLEPYFAADRMEAFEPVCQRIASQLLERLPCGVELDAIEAFATPFSLLCQSAFLGWPDTLLEPLRQWTQRNRKATFAEDRSALARLADEFRSHVGALLTERRARGPEAPDDITASLMRARVNGALLTDEELTSVLRNWTVGEVGSLAAAVGILTYQLSVQGELQARLRRDPSLLPAAIDEILRMDGPLVLNRRVATRDVEMGGRSIAAGEPLSLIWLSANRDEQVFDHPEEVQVERDARNNLLYGAGIHICPGAPLARLELRLAMEGLLRCTRRIELSHDTPGRRALYPANGWASLPVRLS
jgi:cytochrome P450